MPGCPICDGSCDQCVYYHALELIENNESIDGLGLSCKEKVYILKKYEEYYKDLKE